MKQWRIIEILTIVCFLSLAAAGEPLRAGQIEPGFRSVLSSLPPDEYVTAIVHLAEVVDLSELTDSLALERAGRREWHESVIRRLKSKALATQSSVLAYLKSGSQLGTVNRFREFWITNAIAVECLPQVLFELETHFDVGTIYLDIRLVLIDPVEEDLANKEVVAFVSLGALLTLGRLAAT